jgi:hypothetical protein
MNDKTVLDTKEVCLGGRSFVVSLKGFTKGGGGFFIKAVVCPIDKKFSKDYRKIYPEIKEEQLK